MTNIENAFFEEMARNDFLSFCVFNDQFFTISPHHEIIANALIRLMNGEIQNLAICMPPRAGKSRIMQEFIAYMLWKVPNTDILYTWHSLSLLQWFSRNIRNRINSPEYQRIFPRTVIAGDSWAVHNWNIEKGGEFAIYGVGGGITGKGGNILVIDDPYATRQDAESSTIRKTVSDWYWSTFLSRRQNDKAKQIIIMQRWREDDLIGEILEREGEKWEVLKIPAIDANWESFWKEKFSAEYFNEIKAQNPIFFYSQYQQEPFSDGNWEFKKDYFRYAEMSDIAEKLNRFQIASFLDPAISQKQEADNSAIVTVAIDTMSNFYYLLEVKKWRMTPDMIIQELFETAKYWFNRGQLYKAGIEVVQYQKMLANAVKDRMRQEDFYFNLEEVTPRGEKEARIRTILQPIYASGRMTHIKGANINDYEVELVRFPNWKHDDMIDACSQAVSILESVSINQNARKIFIPNYDWI